jgi:hypothetical protein
MAEKDGRKPSWIERRRENKRLKQQRAGDSPEKQAERPGKAEPTAKDAAGRAGFAAGGGGL